MCRPNGRAGSAPRGRAGRGPRGPAGTGPPKGCLAFLIVAVGVVTGFAVTTYALWQAVT